MSVFLLSLLKRLFIPLFIPLLFLSACGPSLPIPMVAKALHLPWTHTVRGDVGDLVVDNGIVYVYSLNNIYALDAVSGQEKWATPFYTVYGKHLIIANGVVYASGDNKLAAFDAASGKQKWSVSSSSNMGNPVVADGMVYCGGAKLYAFDAATGQQKWTVLTSGTNSPAAANGVVYVNGGDKRLYAFDAVSGQQKWAVHSDANGYPSSIIANGVIYVSGADKLYAFDAANGQQKWAASDSKPYDQIARLPVVVNGVVYVVGNKLYAFDVASGQQKWATSADGIIVSLPKVADGVVYVDVNKVGDDRRHRLYAFDAATGQQKKWSAIGGSSENTLEFNSVVANGMVYVSDSENDAKDSEVSVSSL